MGMVERLSPWMRVAATVILAYIFEVLFNFSFYGTSGTALVVSQVYGVLLSYLFLWCCTHLKYAGLPIYMLCCALFSALVLSYWTFGYVFTRELVHAVLETNTREASAFFTFPSIAGFIALMAVSYGIFALFRALSCHKNNNKGPLAATAGFLGMALAACLVYFTPTIVFFRIPWGDSQIPSKIVRHFSPGNLMADDLFFSVPNKRPPFEAFTRFYRQPFSNLGILRDGIMEHYAPFEMIDSADAPSCEEKPDKDIICILAVGESTRADHLGFNGYERQTTPQLSKIPQLHPLPHMLSYGGCTDRSLRGILCGWISDRPIMRSSFLSILRKHGYTCTYCTENADDMCNMFRNKPIIGAYLNGVNAYKGSVKEVTADFIKDLPGAGKHFILLQNRIGHYPYDDYKGYGQFSGDAAAPEIVNHYDDTMLALDAMYGGIIAGLQNRNAVLIFTSDHADFMGEDNRWHHGDEFSPVLRRVGAFIWFSESFARNNPELVSQIVAVRNKPIVQGQLYATILKLCGIKTEMPLDIGDIVEDDIRKHPDNNLPKEIQQEIMALPEAE